MDTKNKLELPATGWRLACDPCPECLTMLARMSKALVYPGNQADCYSCGNRMTSIVTEKTGSKQSRFSAMGGYDDTLREYKLTAVAFDRTQFGKASSQKWLEKRDLLDFGEPESLGIEWWMFVKTTDSEACVFAKLGEGVVGRCLLDISAA